MLFEEGTTATLEHDNVARLCHVDEAGELKLEELNRGALNQSFQDGLIVCHRSIQREIRLELS